MKEVLSVPREETNTHRIKQLLEVTKLQSGGTRLQGSLNLAEAEDLSKLLFMFGCIGSSLLQDGFL